MTAPKGKFDWVSDEEIIDCPRCLAEGRGNYPISPAVGHCRRCELKSELTQADLELSAHHAASTDPRSVASASEIAKRLWERGVDTRVRRAGQEVKQ